MHLIAHASDVPHPARSHVILALLPHSCSTPIVQETVFEVRRQMRGCRQQQTVASQQQG